MTYLTFHTQVTMATAKRIIQQLLHDKRTIALMFLAPTLLMSLLYWVFSDDSKMFNIFGPALLGVFPFIVMFLVTSITTLRERSSGTMERLMAMPVAKFDIIAGYALAFGLFGAIQSLVTSSVAIYLLGLEVAGPQWFVVAIAILGTILGVALGLFVSAFAKTEFQAVQFMPALIFPQVIICGLFVPLEKLPDILESVAYAMPLTYAVHALNEVVSQADITTEMWRDVVVVGLFIIASLVIASLTLRRKS